MNREEKALLQVKNLSFGYGPEGLLLRDVSLNLEPGGLLTILGSNGAGKSTLLNCIAGLLTPTAGTVLLHGQPLATLSRRQIARQIAYVSQQAPQTYHYTVRDYVVLGRAAHLDLLAVPGAADYERVDEALARLRCEPLAGKTYRYCSGGEKQLVNIAKILVQEPQLILFDEPTAALDYGNVFKTLSLIADLSAAGFAIIMTTHNPDHPLLLAERCANSRVALLQRSGRLESGGVAEMITAERLQALYQIDLRLVHPPELARPLCAIQSL